MHIEPNLPDTVSCPGEPTNAPPGSECKIRILTERASRREALFNPKDYTVRKESASRTLPVESPMRRMESA